ncbi:hypothetical protein FRC08_016326 [Ceratobasidium sp. 394]|nr:hypothetical protein FRC08_016326 [Ceratobasidium sp. 394]KAG9096676.1 hypothetical protein FS749_007972 [Ceratobasidium sp. UAMH 11750]
MSYGSNRPETPPSVILPSAGLAGPSIFDLSSLPSDTPNEKGTGHGGADLSLSDLSMTDSRVNVAKTARGAGTSAKWDEEEEYEPDPPFRLFNESPAPKRVIQEPEEEEEPAQDEEDPDQTIAQSERSARDDDLDEAELSIHTPQRTTRPVDSPPPSVYSRSRTAAEKREEQLHAALFQLRKMNAVFGDYVGALDAVQGNTERLERQVERTNAILDRYVKMLGQQEQIAKLVLDEEWGGGESDEQILQERIEQKAREERERKEREERERREREERERQAAERALAEQEARERTEKAAASTRGRGTRGISTRGTVRGGARGSVSGASTSGIGRGAPAARPSSVAGTSRISRPSSVASTRGSATRARGRGGAA